MAKRPGLGADAVALRGVGRQPLCGLGVSYVTAPEANCRTSAPPAPGSRVRGVSPVQLASASPRAAAISAADGLTHFE